MRTLAVLALALPLLGCTAHVRGYVGAARHGDGTIVHAGVTGGLSRAGAQDADGKSLHIVPAVGAVVGVGVGSDDAADDDPAFGLGLGADVVRINGERSRFGWRAGALADLRFTGVAAFHHVHAGPTIVISDRSVKKRYWPVERRVLAIGIEVDLGAIRHRDDAGAADYNLGGGGALTLEYTTFDVTSDLD